MSCGIFEGVIYQQCTIDTEHGDQQVPGKATKEKDHSFWETEAFLKTTLTQQRYHLYLRKDNQDVFA